MSSYPCHPEEWIGLGFVATIENAPPEVLVPISSIRRVAAQIAWGLNAQKPDLMEDYLERLRAFGLTPVGWAWCNASDTEGARLEGARHARLALDLGLSHFVANMEEPYDAHGDFSSPRFDMPLDYVGTFRAVAPELDFAVTTTPRWASNHGALRAAGAVHMPQAFSGEVPEATVANCVNFSTSWGWTADRIRPLAQVYETRGVVPASEPFLVESAAAEVGLVPYVVEQALSGQGLELLADLYPAIVRPPKTPVEAGDPMEKIGKQHGITAAIERLRKLDPGGTKPDRDPENLGSWGAYDKLERTLSILAADHDAVVELSSGASFLKGPAQ